MPAIPSLSLDHAHVFASDAAATIAFLQDMFGASIVWDQQVAGVRGIRLRIGQAFIHIYDQPPRAPRGGAVHHLGIRVKDLPALIAHMERRGHVFRNPVRQAEDFRYVMVAGPDELLIELFEPLDPAAWGV